MTGELPAQKASNAENISIWWRHHVEVGLKMFNDSYSFVKYSIVFQQITHTLKSFIFKFWLVQNIIQTNLCMSQRLGSNRIACEISFILEVVIIGLINTLFSTRW